MFWIIHHDDIGKPAKDLRPVATGTVQGTQEQFNEFCYYAGCAFPCALVEDSNTNEVIYIDPRKFD